MANSLTLFRVALIPLFMLALALGERGYALAFFLTAAITDLADGAVARGRGETSPLGEIMDPIADKLLTTGALVILVYDQTIAGLDVAAAFLILAREIAVSGLRDFLGRVGAPLPVAGLAKVKTVLQVIALGMLVAGPIGEPYVSAWIEMSRGALWLATALTLWTGWSYVVTARRALAEL